MTQTHTHAHIHKREVPYLLLEEYSCIVDRLGKPCAVSVHVFLVVRDGVQEHSPQVPCELSVRAVPPSCSTSGEWLLGQARGVEYMMS
jgi:hypothetical protein